MATVGIVPIVMPVHNRLELTQQAIESLEENTDHPYQLIVVDDASTDPEVLDYLRSKRDIRLITMPTRTHHGACKNAGASVAVCSDYIYFSDNDVYFSPGWLSTMLEHAEAFPQVGVLGGDRHPWHEVEGWRKDGSLIVEIAYTQVGYSMLIKQDVWRAFGPFRHDPLTTYGQDDVALCDVVKRGGFLTGSVSPRVVYHCGITKTDGSPALGAEVFITQDGPERIFR